MDNLYRSIKGLIKSFLNLFLAIIDLVSSLINGIAAILGRLRPRISQKYTELKSESGIHNLKDISGVKGREEILVEEIRNELRQKVTSREKYLYLSACAENEGTGFYAGVVSVLVFALFGVSMLFDISNYREVRITGIVIMAILCIGACVIIAIHQKKMLKNKLIRQILEEEFADKIWEQPDVEKQQPEQMAVIQSISAVGK